MRFWDASAVVPLLVMEESTPALRALVAEDPVVVAWWGTPAECASALARLRREEVLTARDEERCLSLLAALRASWTEVLPSNEVRDRAIYSVMDETGRAPDLLRVLDTLGEITVLGKTLEPVPGDHHERPILAVLGAAGPSRRFEDGRQVLVGQGGLPQQQGTFAVAGAQTSGDSLCGATVWEITAQTLNSGAGTATSDVNVIEWRSACGSGSSRLR